MSRVRSIEYRGLRKPGMRTAQSVSKECWISAVVVVAELDLETAAALYEPEPESRWAAAKSVEKTAAAA
jgi:hypothetical protein